MDTENTEKDIDLRPVTKIIASYVGNHTLSPEQLPALIISVQQALRDLGKPAPVPVPRTPAVPIRRSVQHDQWQDIFSIGRALLLSQRWRWPCLFG